MKTYDYVVIGSGLPGMTLKRFLNNQSVVLLDPNPCGYKVGESILPEHFHNLEVRALLPQIRQLPSYTRKWGTMFIADDAIAAFPLPENLSAIAMHVARSELESLMVDAWDIQTQNERAIDVDIETRTVTTENGSYRAAKQIIDCSGPAMVVAQSLGEVEEIQPVHATWAYHQITGVKRWSGHELARRTNRSIAYYDPTKAALIPNHDFRGWMAEATTSLTRIREGTWMWQIPLFEASLLSVGVISREAPISESEYDEIVRANHLPCFRLEACERNGRTPYHRIYERQNFARRAHRASTEDYILVADAFSFNDPVYSAGTAMAVNKAIQVAEMLNDGDGWSREKSDWYNAQYERLVEAVNSAFEHWYSQELVTSSEVARKVQEDILSGRLFSQQMAEWYNTSLRCSMGDSTTEEHHNFPDLDGL